MYVVDSYILQRSRIQDFDTSHPGNVSIVPTRWNARYDKNLLLDSPFSLSGD